MRKFLLASVALTTLALAAPASAADLPIAKAPPIAYVYDWSGFYIGVDAGYNWGHTGYRLGVPPIAGTGTGFNVNGGLIGMHGGYNWQFSQWVLGLEGDILWNGADGDDGGFPGGNLVDRLEGRWQGSIRGRVGYAMNTWLLYATGGWSWLNARYTKTIFGTSSSDSATLNGYTVGAGVEYAFAPNWLGRAEYRYSSYDSKSFYFPGLDRTLNRTHTNQLTFGISYKFGGNPVVASY